MALFPAALSAPAARRLSLAALAGLAALAVSPGAAAGEAAPQACLEQAEGARCAVGESELRTGFCMRELESGPLRCLSGMSIGGLLARTSERGATRSTLSVGPFLQAPPGAASSTAAHLPTLSIAPELDVTPEPPPPSGGWLAFALSNAAGLLGLAMVFRTRRDEALSLDEI